MSSCAATESKANCHFYIHCASYRARSPRAQAAGSAIATGAKTHKAKTAALSFVDLPALSEDDKVQSRAHLQDNSSSSLSTGLIIELCHGPDT